MYRGFACRSSVLMQSEQNEEMLTDEIRHNEKVLPSADEIRQLRSPQFVLGRWQKPKMSAKSCAKLRKEYLAQGLEWPFPRRNQPHLTVPKGERRQRTPKSIYKEKARKAWRARHIEEKKKQIPKELKKEQKMRDKERKREEEKRRQGARALFPEGRWRNPIQGPGV
eukprot:CAMPEP_0201552944 /NCGR_PEP_ID=MMETSP0173_2-20130828/19355_1 /ASSEMBLY_ACC=CAM_ASM_000268 /TAXON_ID=218659 /ORGANISM="Vexillifera sp., Strain DIVA3 564/2" /LENGTH=166 /DNA_ID=CAMNT_0047963535 /DNA_START=93 /DNA_END=593 /DNA_ORIENTATION=-